MCALCVCLCVLTTMPGTNFWLAIAGPLSRPLAYLLLYAAPTVRTLLASLFVDYGVGACVRARVRALDAVFFLCWSLSVRA